jgi:hypothetical protein
VSETQARSPDEAPAPDAGERLQHTIDIVCENAARVELWASALNWFAQPVPDYDFGTVEGRESNPNKG